MTARRLLILLVLALIPAPAFAQLDDLLAPLTPEKKAEPKKKRAKKKAVRKETKKPKQETSGTEDLLAPLVPQKSQLWVKVAGPAEGATVHIDDRQVRPGERIEVEPGEHQVTVTRPGFSEFSRRVRVMPGESLEVPALMDAVAGVLEVTSDVPESTVHIDGRAVGEAPVRGVLLSPGQHEVVVRREGFEDHVSRLSVRAGRDYTVNGVLKPQARTSRIVASDGDRPEKRKLVPEDSYDADERAGLLGTEEKVSAATPWYSRWYVWAGVGAVAVAAATTTAVATSNQGYTPSEVCDLDPRDGKPGTCHDVINDPAAALLRMGLNLRIQAF